MNKRTIAHVGSAYKQRIAADSDSGALFVAQNHNGSTFAAPRAGMYQPARATTANKTLTDNKLIGSLAAPDTIRTNFPLWRSLSALGRFLSHFAGQSGGQGLQQSRVCDGAAALTGWFPA